MLRFTYNAIYYEIDDMLIAFKWYRRWHGGLWYRNKLHDFPMPFWSRFPATGMRSEVIAVEDYDLRKV